jgi:hypothetical protein
MGSSSSIQLKENYSAGFQRGDDERRSFNSVGEKISKIFSSNSNSSLKSKRDEDDISSSDFISNNFLGQVNRLVHDEMEFGMYLTFLSNRLWEDILFPDLKLKLLQSTFAHLTASQQYNERLSDTARKIVMDENFPMAQALLSMKDILIFLTLTELRSLFIAVTLSCYFQFRSHFDFALDTTVRPATSRELLLNSLYVRKEELSHLESFEKEIDSLKQSLEDIGEERIIDPETIMTLIALHSPVDDLSWLLSSGEWLRYVSGGIERLGFSIAIWNLNELPEEKENIKSDFPIIYSNKISSFDSSSSSIIYSLTSTVPEDYSMPCIKSPTDQENTKSPSETQKCQIQQSLSARKELHFLKNYFNLETYRDRNIQNSRKQELPQCIQYYQQALFHNESLKLVIMPANESKKAHQPANGIELKEPLFFGLLPTYNYKNNYYLVTIHCPLKNLVADKLFYGMIDFLFFCIGGIQKQN